MTNNYQCEEATCNRCYTILFLLSEMTSSYSNYEVLVISSTTKRHKIRSLHFNLPNITCVMLRRYAMFTWMHDERELV